MMLDNVIAYWRFPAWVWAIAIGSLVGYVIVVITNAIND